MNDIDDDIDMQSESNSSDTDDDLEHKYDSPNEQTSSTCKIISRKRPFHYHSLSNSDRERIVRLRLNNTKPAQIPAALQLPKPTIYSVIRTLNKENRTDKKYKGGSQKQYLPEDRKILGEIQDRNNAITYKDLREQWKDATGNYEKKLSNATINKILKEQKFSTKCLYHTPLERNSIENIEKRKQYSIEAASYDINDIVFLDETGFNLHTNRNRGRSRIGVRATTDEPGQLLTNLLYHQHVELLNGN
jgi:hypothetical protein